MTSQAAARRALSNVQAAAWIVRIIALVDMVAGVLSMFLHEVDVVSGALMLIGSAAFVQPLLPACLYSRKPETSNRSCVVLGKYVLYFWLFMLNCALAPFILYGFMYVIMFGGFLGQFYYLDTAISIILLLVVFVTCIILTAVNLYTFCILHKNGCCFLYRLRRNIEEADATNLRIVATPTEYIYRHVPEFSRPCNPPPYSVSNQPGEGVAAFAVGIEPGKCF